jgi:hypothetical protein
MGLNTGYPQAPAPLRMGRAGERLWITLRQRLGRTN